MSKSDKIMKKMASVFSFNLLDEDLARSAQIPESYKLKKMEKAVKDLSEETPIDVESRGRKARNIFGLLGAGYGGIIGKANKLKPLGMAGAVGAGALGLGLLGKLFGQMSGELVNLNIDKAKQIIGSADVSQKLKEALYDEIADHEYHKRSYDEYLQEENIRSRG